MKKYFDNPSYAAAFERCINLMSGMIVKYGPKVLKKQRQELMNMLSNPDYCMMPEPKRLLHRMQRYHIIYEKIKKIK